MLQKTECLFLKLGVRALRPRRSRCRCQVLFLHLREPISTAAFIVTTKASTICMARFSQAPPWLWSGTGGGIALSYGAVTINLAVGGTGVQAFKR